MYDEVVAAGVEEAIAILDGRKRENEIKAQIASLERELGALQRDLLMRLPSWQLEIGKRIDARLRELGYEV